MLDEKVFAYLVKFSKKNHYFPLIADVAVKFKMSRTGPMESIYRLVRAGRIEKIGRYNWRIPLKFFK